MSKESKHGSTAWEMAPSLANPDRKRGIFCNRTLNLHSIRAIGYDLDYTLVHYKMEAWEERAYAYIKERLQADGWPIGHLQFDSDLVMRGLVIDIELGNVVKANRFGYIKRSFHGTKRLDFDVQHRTYSRVLVDLNEPRWIFLNTLFSISEACLFMQLVDLLDEGILPNAIGYPDLYKLIRRSLDEAHMEGRLKGEIVANPDNFVVLDEELPITLMDQREAGKKIFLISNSDWSYVSAMLSYAVGRFLPSGMSWRDLFDMIIVGARKPAFFSYKMPVFEVVSEDGLLREHNGLLKPGRAYLGGDAGLVEKSLGLRGEEILYVGDHMFVDVKISKSIHRWRTALVIRELEAEIAAFQDFAEQHVELNRAMSRKEELEGQYARLRLDLQRAVKGYLPSGNASPKDIERTMSELHQQIVLLDTRIAPLAQAAGKLLNPNWGPLMRTGIDKSHLARQVERYADIYMAKVSNFLYSTPFAFLRSPRGSLPHDPV